MRTTILKLFLISIILISSIGTEAQENNLIQNKMDKTNCECQCGNQYTGMCEKLPMEADGIVRLSKIEVYPEYLDEYIKYASKAAYEQHIASEHFQKYKQGTLHMVKSLLLSDQIPLNPYSHINNVIRQHIKAPSSNRYHYGKP